jgi:hypothetical protein
MVPGLIEPETPDWVYPIGVPGCGSAQSGTFDPPAIGATVAVLFKMGSIDHPRFLTGPWGAPGGTVDAPEGAEVEGDDRQNAVTGDQEWSIERDSRSSDPRYLIGHRGSDLALLVDGLRDRIMLAREDAEQAAIKGTDYQSAMGSLLASLQTNINAAGVALNAAGNETNFATAFPLAAGSLVTAGGALVAAAGVIGSSGLTSSTAHLSEKVFLE